MNMQESNEIRVKNEPICESQSISQTNEAKSKSILVKDEPIDIEIKTSSKSQVEVKDEEEFVNKTSIALETTSDNNPITNQATTSNNQANKTQNKKTNKLQKSK